MSHVQSICELTVCYDAYSESVEISDEFIELHSIPFYLVSDSRQQAFQIRRHALRSASVDCARHAPVVIFNHVLLIRDNR